MNKILWVGCALSLIACGRIEQGDEDDSVAATPLDCVYGPIATTSGPIAQLASAGDTLFVVNGTFEPSKTANTNTLSAIAKDGTVSAVSAVPNPSDGVVPIGASLAFITRTLDDEGRTTTATLSLLHPDHTVTMVDSFTLSAPTYQLNGATTDGAGSLYWYRWEVDPGNRVEIMKRAPDGSITSYWPDPSFPMLGRLLTDGTSMFAAAVTSSEESVGRLGVDGAAALTIASSSNSHQSTYDTVGLDDDGHLLYSNLDINSGTTIFAVPKNGGASTQIMSTSSFEGGLVRDHHLYWSDGRAITRVKTEGQPITKIIATPSDAIETFTTDACGVVYATSPLSGGASSIYRARF